jgi:hypothetical protein
VLIRVRIIALRGLVIAKPGTDNRNQRGRIRGLFAKKTWTTCQCGPHRNGAVAGRSGSPQLFARLDCACNGGHSAFGCALLWQIADALYNCACINALLQRYV